MMPKQRKKSDLRYKFIRYLIAHEKHQRKFGYLKAAAEWTSRAIVSLDLHEGEIRSVKQAQQLEAIGGTIAEKLKTAVNSSYSSMVPVKGTFASSASALLITLYDLTKEAKHINPDDENPLIHFENLRERSREICEEIFADSSSSSSSSSSVPVLCNAWWRIRILEARNYVKKRTRSKEDVYQLLPLGLEIAERLTGNDPVNRKSPNAFSLCNTDNGIDGIVMQIDHRELGGENGNLNKIKHMLSKQSVKFQVKALDVGDYNWLLRRDGQEIVLPIVVERKRGDDFAESISDGRLIRQKEKMKKWKSEFGRTSDLVQLIFIIEGSIQKYVVTCGHECVGKCGNPSLVEVATVLHDLENDPEFIVLHTPHVEKTVGSLINITTELNIRINAGDFNEVLAPLFNKDLDADDTSQKCIVIKDEHDAPSLSKPISLEDELGPNISCDTNIPNCSKYDDNKYGGLFADEDVKNHHKTNLIDCENDSDSDDSQLLYVSPFTCLKQPSFRIQNRSNAWNNCKRDESVKKDVYSIETSKSNGSRNTLDIIEISDEPMNDRPFSTEMKNLSNERVSQLKSIFPNKSDTEILRVLSEADNIVEVAVETLLTSA